MEDVSTLKILLTLVKEGDKESFRNVQKMNSDYPDIFFDIVKMGLYKNPLMIRECMRDDFYTRHSDFFCEFIKEQPSRISSIPSSAIFANLEFAKAAIEDDGSNIRHIPKQVVLSNPFLLFSAIKNNTLSLNCASRAFQKDNADFIVECLMRDPRGMKNVSSELEKIMGYKFDDIILSNPSILHTLRFEQVVNRGNTIMNALKKNPMEYKELSPEVKKYFPKLAHVAARFDPELFLFVPREVLLCDEEFCLECSRTCVDAAIHMPLEILLNNSEIYKNCLKNSTKPSKIITVDTAGVYYDLILEEIRIRPKMVKYISDLVLLKYPGILYEAVRQDYSSYEFLSQVVKESLPEAAKIAFDINPSALLWIPFQMLPKL